MRKKLKDEELSRVLGEQAAGQLTNVRFRKADAERWFVCVPSAAYAGVGLCGCLEMVVNNFDRFGGYGWNLEREAWFETRAKRRWSVDRLLHELEKEGIA